MGVVMENYNHDKLERAKKRVNEIKGFYIHLAVYLVINIFILVNIGLQSNNFWHWGHFITPFFWGIGLFFHWINTFGKNPFFSKNWEERQIKKYMDRDREDANKFLK